MKESQEQNIVARAERNAEFYVKRFGSQMEALEHSPIAKARSLTVFDYCGLGEMLSQFDTYAKWVKEEGTVSDLGKLPSVAFDIITAAYGASIVPLICSVQPIEEARGTIYFKQTKALNTRGNVTANQLVRNSIAAPAVYSEGYAGEKVTGPETPQNTANSTLTYTGSVQNTSHKVRPNSVKVSIATASPLKAIDDGEGNLLGVGCYGTINYSTGAYSITLAANPAGVFAISIQYGSDYENGAAIPKIATVLGSASIDAEIFVLGTELGMFKAFSMQKRFGRVAEDDMIQDLTNEITAEIGNTAIARLTAASVGTVDWSKTHVGFSWHEHKQQLKDRISEAEATILQNSGRGVVNFLIAGSYAASVLSNLPGFTKTAVTGSGPQLYGTLDGMTVIRSPQTDTNSIFCVYKGSGFFDAPIVYSPYMPLFVSNTLPLPGNILQKQGVAAVWAGLQVVVPTFCSKVRIVA